jgi:hypothetical protein
LALIN